MNFNFHFGNDSRNYRHNRHSSSYHGGHDNGPVGALIAGVIFIVIGVFVILIGQDEIFSCSKAKNACTNEKKGVFSNKKEVLVTIPLSSIKSAKVVEIRSRDSGSTYRMELVTQSGTTPAFSSSGVHSKASSQVNQFNSFLSSGKDSVAIKDNLWFLRLFGIIFIIGGILALFQIPKLLKGEIQH